MARTNKTGIDYFPFDVDFFADDKLQLIEAEFGIKGGYIAVRLLCKIYRDGYFYKWGADECLLFAKSMGVEGVSKNIVDEIVSGLVRRCFFDKGCFDRFGILTSKGIQKRYFEVAKRYKSVDVIEDYLLVDVSEMNNVNINSINVDINSINADINRQKKRKEIEKEIERENKIFPHDDIFESVSELQKRLRNTEWIQSVGMKLKINPDNLLQKFNDFADEIVLKGDPVKTEKDFKSHFINWLNKKKEKGGIRNESQSKRYDYV